MQVHYMIGKVDLYHSKHSTCEVKITLLKLSVNQNHITNEDGIPDQDHPSGTVSELALSVGDPLVLLI